jgi:hypothetical protein
MRADARIAYANYDVIVRPLGDAEVALPKNIVIDDLVACPSSGFLERLS